MRPFGYPVTILNTINHLAKFDGKADEGFFVGYYLNTKAFRVFNSRTRIVEENMHIRYTGLMVSHVQKQVIMQSSHDDGSKPSSDDGNKVDEDPRKENEYNKLPFDPNMHALEDVSIFNFLNVDEDDGIVADINNLDTIIQVSPILTIRIHKEHPLDQVIGDFHSATQTRMMSKNL
uniref:Ribonuclease H-like domain-containing protein n=1 Tax=Tanacetum cinerariifolium TaxID=118510 RepID=A0A699QJT1_TANCI|nr:ribonuclease H-like domain-containing protein [Tanacetum cinerariifolium]